MTASVRSPEILCFSSFQKGKKHKQWSSFFFPCAENSTEEGDCCCCRQWAVNSWGLRFAWGHSLQPLTLPDSLRNLTSTRRAAICAAQWTSEHTTRSDRLPQLSIGNAEKNQWGKKCRKINFWTWWRETERGARQRSLSGHGSWKVLISQV